MDAAIVGSGPNGLAAAIRLAQAGLRVRVYEAAATIGGGLRTEELTLPGFRHDVCSAVHPFALLSPFFATLPLTEHGLEWIIPEVAIAHPLDDGTAACVARSLDDTAAALGADGETYRKMLGPLAAHLGELAEDVLAPITHVPRHPLLLARFGMRAGLSAKTLTRLEFTEARTRALFAGLAAHSFLRLDRAFTASLPLLFAACAHAYGWPIPRGGAAAIANALASHLRSLGGEIVTGTRIESLPAAELVLADTSPAAFARLGGERLPASYRERLLAWEPGPGVFKLDYALSAPVPWRAPECRRAGTVHLGGTFEEIAASEEAVTSGEHPARPFVLVTQPSLFDSTRAPAGKHVLWAYCHVPNGSRVDMTDRLEAQIVRFAPGFRELVLARSRMDCADFERHNPNYIGGDISGGVGSFFARPTAAFDPYAAPARGLYLCSASTPPGAGVHGMCGFHAAESALSAASGHEVLLRQR